MLDLNSTLFAAAPPGLEPVLFAEIKALGFENGKASAGGVSFTGDFEVLCNANLRLRTAARVLLRVGQFFAAHVSELHKKSSKIPWENFVSKTTAIDVRASCRKSKIYHSEAAAQRVAQGIADRLRLTDLPTFGEGGPDEEGGKTCVMVRLDRDHCTLSIDTTGAHLHRRGYRLHTGVAPLRENLAAAVLYMSGWSPETETLIDPMCGSGTIPIEGALIASNTPPGIFRSFGFESLPFFESAIFEETKARLRSHITSPALPIMASDISDEAVRSTVANAERAKAASYIEVSQQDVVHMKRPAGDCLVLTNPPYGKRIGERRKLRGFYRSLADTVRRLERTQLAIISDDVSLFTDRDMGFESASAPFPNGGIRVQLFSTKKM
jgi:putative N6-adenine-specific DNA methylase